MSDGVMATRLVLVQKSPGSSPGRTAEKKLKSLRSERFFRNEGFTPYYSEGIAQEGTNVPFLYRINLGYD